MTNWQSLAQPFTERKVALDIVKRLAKKYPRWQFKAAIEK